jgi:polyphosphate kinase 2
MISNPLQSISKEEFESISTKSELIKLIKTKDLSFVNQVFEDVKYEKQLRELQAELINLQQHITKKKMRVAILFEGRDAAGKGGSIKRFIEHLNPRSSRIVALSKPTEMESGQWFFRRYVKELPNPGEIVFYDRSWYNRAVVEPVMGFCTTEQYERFLVQVPEFEHMLYESGVHIIKFWFSISKNEQQRRFEERINNPLKSWKYSPVDQKGQELWDKYTFYKEQMFSKTHTAYCPWNIVRANDKHRARLEAMRFVLSSFEYAGKGKNTKHILPDPDVVMRYHRRSSQLDI